MPTDHSDILSIFDGDDLHSRLRGFGVELRTFAALLRLPGLIVFGEWDPLLRQIRVFGTAVRSDGELVETLLHETSHATGETFGDEALTRQAAADRLAAIDGTWIRRWATMLRRMSGPMPASPSAESAAGSGWPCFLRDAANI